MAIPWYDVPITMPSNGQQVYCRPYDYYGTPFLATYSTVKDDFTDDTNSIVYPAYIIRRWRPVT